MALKWKDLIDEDDVASAEQINKIAHSIIDIEKGNVKVGNSKSSDYALNANMATLADVSLNSNNADYSNKAKNAENADFAEQAGRSYYADESLKAGNADHSAEAEHSEYADESERARVSEYSDKYMLTGNSFGTDFLGNYDSIYNGKKDTSLMYSYENGFIKFLDLKTDDNNNQTITDVPVQIEIDSTPTKDSKKPVNSGGVYEALQPFYVTFTSANGYTVDSVDKTFEEVNDAIEQGRRVKAIYSDNGRVFDLSMNYGDNIIFSNNTSTVHYTFTYTKTSATISDSISPTYADIIKDDKPTEGSTNLITSGGVYEAIKNISPGGNIEVTDVVEEGNTNPVTSGGVYNALEYSLVARNEITEEDITNAGNNGITAITAQLNNNLTFGAFREIMVTLYIPVNSRNTTNGLSHLNIGNSESDILISDKAVVSSQTANYAPIYYDKVNRMSFKIELDNDKKPLNVLITISGAGAIAYPITTYGVGRRFDNLTFKKAKYILFKSRKNDFYFPAGTILEVYAR